MLLTDRVMGENYYGETEAQDALAVVALWIADDEGIIVEYTNEQRIYADIYTRTIYIPRLACASGLTYEALMLLRGSVYHEAGHIKWTKLARAAFPKGVLKEIWNGVEDPWMESEVGNEFAGCEDVFNWSGNYYNQKIAGQINDGLVAPLWEALCGMMLKSRGLNLKWDLTPKAQAYVDAAYNVFLKFRQSSSSKENLDIAKEIHEIIKETSEEFNKNQGGQSNPDEEGDDKSQGGQGQKQNEKGEKEEGEKEEGQNSGGSGGSPKDVDDEQNEGSGSGSGEESDEGKGEGGESEGSGEEGEGEGEGQGKGEGEGEGSGESEGEGGDSEGSQEGHEGGKEPKGSSKPGKGNKSDSEPQGNSKSDEELEAELEKELEGGKSLADFQAEDIEEIFKRLRKQGRKPYTSLKESDEHIVPANSDGEKERYSERQSEVSTGIAAVTRSLEQALRTLSRSRVNRFQKKGRIDRRRLAHIAKGVSREVFFTTTEGINIDTVVEIIIDESGSMADEYKDVQLMALAIGESLSKVGIPFEITGTTTKYSGGDYNMPPLNGFARTNPIVYRHYKSFNEDWKAVRSRIVNSSAHYHNIDGEAVEQAALRLSGRKEKRKVIFSLSDGNPCGGQGHLNDLVLEKNLKKVCENVRKAGIEVYGFGIQTEAPSAYYGAEWFVHLDSIDDMGFDFAKKFAEIVTKGQLKLG